MRRKRLLVRIIGMNSSKSIRVVIPVSIKTTWFMHHSQIWILSREGWDIAEGVLQKYDNGILRKA